MPSKSLRKSRTKGSRDFPRMDLSHASFQLPRSQTTSKRRPARRSRRLRYPSEEDIAELRALRLADSGDGPELGQVRGARLGHSGELVVGEDRVDGKSLVLGGRLPELAEARISGTRQERGFPCNLSSDQPGIVRHHRLSRPRHIRRGWTRPAPGLWRRALSKSALPGGRGGSD